MADIINFRFTAHKYGKSVFWIKKAVTLLSAKEIWSCFPPINDNVKGQ